MGVGKTTVGRLLAERLRRPFLDSDDILETQTGGTAATIVSGEGVESLHEIELEVFLDSTSDNTPSVIAPAASVVDHDEGRREMARHLTVWLTAPSEVIAERQARGDHRREIEPVEREFLANRRAGWLEAVSRFRIDTGDLTPLQVVDEVSARLREELLL